MSVVYGLREKWAEWTAAEFKTIYQYRGVDMLYVVWYTVELHNMVKNNTFLITFKKSVNM